MGEKLIAHSNALLGFRQRGKGEIFKNHKANQSTIPCINHFKKKTEKLLTKAVSMKHSDFYLTREKHLDHMVMVVPFIVFAYAIQCFFITRIGPVDFVVDGLFLLGGCLVLMIAGFITYDLTHIVKLEDEAFSVSVNWLNFHRTYSYHDLSLIEISESGQSFATLTLTTHNGKKIGFYFIDDPDKIKAWLEKKRIRELQAAA